MKTKVTYMRYMFCKASSFNQPLNKWNVSKVKDMEDMFLDANSFNQPLNNFVERATHIWIHGWGQSSESDSSDSRFSCPLHEIPNV